jgi:ABC-type transporter Mla maintaining outer membrane lipid asymmetry ATPase subunit MlaF
MRSSTSSLGSSEPPAGRPAARATPNAGTTATGDALAVRDLTGPAWEPVIRDVSLAVPDGATHLVLGPIHSGKTMLMRHIVGLEPALRGTVVVGGEEFELTDPTADELRRLRTRIGVVFEGSALVSRISAIENVELPLLEHTEASADEARSAARELLAEAGLDVDDETVPGELMRHQRRRVAIARAVALRPPIVLLDEPTLGLDAHSAHELDEVIARLQEAHGFAVLIFSHEVRHAFGRASQIYVMAGGEIVARGDRLALQESDNEIVRRLLHRRGRS